MKKKLFLPSFILLIILLQNNNALGQCNTSLTSAATTTNLYTTTGQSFQVSCTGILGTITFTPTANSSVDVFNPGENISVGARLLNASGAVLATGLIGGQTTTDSWGPGITKSFDFTTANINLIANTTYRWELYNNFGTLYLLTFSSSNLYTNGTAFYDGVAQTTSDFHGWIVNVNASAQNSFTIGSNTNVVTSGNVTINYKGGALTNNGTITNNAGSLAFSAPVTFAGTGTTNTRNLKIQHTGTSLLNNRINVAGSLEVSNGSLNANNNLTLISNATSSAVIAPVAAGSSITGKVTVQRYIPQGKRAFRFVTPSVTTDNFISNNWQLATHITGSTTGANGFDATGTGNPSLFTYNNQQASGTGWTPIATTNATNLEATKGYRLLVRGDRNVNINAASLANMNNPITLTATGTVATGTVALTTSSNPAMNNTTNTTTNGYTLIGNPYVNTVNWNTLTKSGLTDAYYAWDANMGTAAQRGRYVVFSTATGSNNMASAVNQFIQPGQAFFVKNTTLGTAGSITFNETDKLGTNINPTFFRTSATALARLDLQVFETNEMALSTNPIDAAVAVFGSEFSNQLETGDVEKLSTGIENLSFLNSATSLAIDARPTVIATDELAVQLQEFQASKSYTFRPLFSNFDPTTTPFLWDTYLSQYTPLALDTPTNVTFTTTSDAASYASNRFKIVFQDALLSNPTFNAAHVVLYPNPVASNQFNIALPSYFTGKVNVSIINTLGQEVYTTSQDAQNTLAINPTSVLAQGMYLVQITNQGTTITKKITIQ